MNVRMTPSDDPKYPDDETRQIVESMEKDGITPPFATKPKESDKKPDDEDDNDNKGDDTDKPDDKAKDEKPPKKGEDSKANLEDDQQDDVERKPRRQVAIPVARANQNAKAEYRRGVAETESKLASQLSDLTNQVKTLTERIDQGNGTKADQTKVDDNVDEIAKIAKDIADQESLDNPESVAKIISATLKLAKAGVQLPSDLKADIDTIKTKLAEQDKEKEAQTALTEYEDEFSKDILSNKDIVAQARAVGLTTAQLKDRIKDIVLGKKGERYVNLTLPEVFQLEKANLLPKRAKSADATRGRSTVGTSDTADFEILTPEEIANLSDAEFETYSNNLGKSQKSKITRGGRLVN